MQFGGVSPCYIPGAGGIVLYLQWDVFYRNSLTSHLLLGFVRHGCYNCHYNYVVTRSILL